ncbi:MAG: tRNA 2-thiouridine(34) synthase MnmA [Thermotogae bacterium]|nr:tRNA 2-thiouridine(34) synthase MnmA [Thermotogota bacterium]MCP5465920.1 tRNA 2-thiouridine(34) synthase MnmA [Thermotogota bacterium]HOO74059.1 tRNA 2-thiouridine(34) synthase MnmA [Tepiditoga sp.]
MNSKKIVMLMSGGVDSSVAAYLLKKEGYSVIGLHYKMVDDHIFDLIPEKKKVCCSPSDTLDALKVSNDIGLDDFKVIKIKDEFDEKIIKYFVNEYKNGITPNPCVLCNRFFKFGHAFEYAKEIGASYVASGHYVVSEFSEDYGMHVIKKGVDNYKDQSYFLSQIKKEYLPNMYFPLGKLKKEEIRKIAEEIGLSVAKKPDSQELCFIPDNDYKRFLRDRGVAATEGNVVDTEGNVIGTHTGYINYTIGQRAGLTYFKAIHQKLHVYRIIPGRNEIVVAPTEMLYSDTLTAGNLNILTDFENGKEIRCRIRKKSEEEKAVINIKNNKAEIKFLKKIFAITPGQFAVFYDENGVVLGSGTILKNPED